MRAELDAALAELRELARGIHPSVLTDRGLEPALTALATRSTVPVELDLDSCGKLPMSVQTTAYFVVAEALTNASKHAHADGVDVRVAVDDGRATVEVRDDGSGGVDPAKGSGLTGLADRVSALGGTLEIDSPAGAGTTIRAQLPLAARVPARVAEPVAPQCGAWSTSSNTPVRRTSSSSGAIPASRRSSPAIQWGSSRMASIASASPSKKASVTTSRGSSWRRRW